MLNNGGYLIPANTKNAQLIFGRFTESDLILFAAGASVTVILLITLGVQGILQAAITLSPVLICSFLIMPIPNYRNIKTFIKSGFDFYINQRVYKWKGWCMYE